MDIKSLRAEFTAIHAEATAFADANKDKEISADDQTAQDARFAKMDRLEKQITDAEKLAAYKFERNEIVPENKSPDRKAFEAAEKDNGVSFDKIEFGKSFTKWGTYGATDAKFATITSATSSGLLLPKTVGVPLVPTFGNSIRKGMKYYSVTPTQTDDTAALTIPVFIGTAGAVVAENASSETENVPSLDSLNLNVSTYQSGSVYFSNLEFRATTYDLGSQMVPCLIDEKELALESAIMAAIIADSGITQVQETSTTAAFTAVNLANFKNKLANRFNEQRVIILGNDAYAAAEGLIGSDGQYVLRNDPDSELQKYKGVPVFKSDYLEAFGASKVIGVILSLKGFGLRDVSGAAIQRYDQNAAKPNQTGFNLFAYHGYDYVVSAVAKLKTPAS